MGVHMVSLSRSAGPSWMLTCNGRERQMATWLSCGISDLVGKSGSFTGSQKAVSDAVFRVRSCGISNFRLIAAITSQGSGPLLADLQFPLLDPSPHASEAPNIRTMS